jgi:hypothetical protein
VKIAIHNSADRSDVFFQGTRLLLAENIRLSAMGYVISIYDEVAYHLTVTIGNEWSTLD